MMATANGLLINVKYPLHIRISSTKWPPCRCERNLSRRQRLRRHWLM